jgi:nitric oxide dioxygenase
MLSDQTKAIVRSTAPILEEHGVALTTHFYKRMFEHDPEVLPYFNPANQAAGKQPRALAGAVLAYAQHIDDLSVLGDAVELIAQKHAALMVRPDQYEVVGRNLLASIKEVLGDGATEEVIEAWGQAYGTLADILIAREETILDLNEKEPGGWRGFKPFRVVKTVRESAVVTSFHLAPDDGGALPRYEPGQYLTVRVPYEPTGTQMRNYSISDAPGGDAFRISVKREPAAIASAPEGYASSYLHEQVAEGDRIDVGPPCGEFTLGDDLHDDGPLVVLAGGIGITVLLSMLKAALATNPSREVVLLEGARNLEVRAFGDELAALQSRHPNFRTHLRLSEPGSTDLETLPQASMGLLDDALLEEFIPAGTLRFYFCGPQAFMLLVRDLLARRGVPDERIKYEFYGPLQAI